MKAKLAIIICIGTIALLTNCTIEKRVFQKGYHIEWKKKTLSENTPDEFGKVQASYTHSEKQTQEEQTVPAHDTETNSPAPGKTASEATNFHTRIKPANETAASSRKASLPGAVSAEPEPVASKKEITPADQKDDDVQPQNVSRKFEPTGIASFIFYFLAVILGLFAIIATNPVAVLSFTALLLLLALILGIVSVTKFRKNRDLYEKNFFGYFGLIASGSTIILGIFILILYVLAFLFSY